MIDFKLSLDKISVLLDAQSADYLADDFERMVYEPLCCGSPTWQCVQKYADSRPLSYKDNYILRKAGTKEGGIYIGISLIPFTDIIQGWKQMKIEWNPNKTEIPRELARFMFARKVKNPRVQKCDIAFDFPDLKPSQVRFATRKQVMYIGEGDNMTAYISPKQQHLRIKVYDKTKERKRLGVTIPQTCRVEISLKNPKFQATEVNCELDLEYMESIAKALAEIYIPSDLPRLLDNLEEKYGKLDPAFCYLLDSVSPMQQQNAIGFLKSKHTQSKYRAYLKSGTYESFNLDELTLGNEIAKLLNSAIFELHGKYEVEKNETIPACGRVP